MAAVGPILEVVTVGTRGPVPKRSSERRRRNKDGGETEAVEAKASGPVEQPPADETWHPIARDWYLALAVSGQARFYEPSDWATAQYVASAMSRNLEASRFSAQLFAAVASAMSNLLVTEGDRRRVRLEIEREQKAPGRPAAVTAIDDYRDALGS